MNPGHSGTRPARPAAALIAGVLLAACATNPATGRRQLSLVSEAQEIQMGREADQHVASSIGLYPEASLQSYAQRVGAGLAASSERPSLPWTFRGVDDAAVNAFALPGGYVYVTRGLLAHLGSEAELASVVGHEIGHVTARHSVSQMSKAQLLNMGMIVGMILRPQLQNFGGLAQAGLELLFLKYSRDDESQADELGLRYLTRAGYDPSGSSRPSVAWWAEGRLASAPKGSIRNVAGGEGPHAARSVLPRRWIGSPMSSDRQRPQRAVRLLPGAGSERDRGVGVAVVGRLGRDVQHARHPQGPDRWPRSWTR